MDLTLYTRAIEYGKSLCPIIAGQVVVPSGYQNTDQGFMEWFNDSIQYEILNDTVIEFDIRGILTNWVIDEITPTQAREQLLELFTDHFDFAC